MKKRARVVATMILLAAVLAQRSRPSAGEEPAASARLPPPLPAAAPGSGGSALPADGLNAQRHDRAKPDPPIVIHDRAKLRPPANTTERLRTARHAAKTANQRRAPSRPLAHPAKDTAHHWSRSSLATAGKQERDRPLLSSQPNRLSPPNHDPIPWIESGAGVAGETPRAPVPYYHHYPAGPPVYGYPPTYPYQWSPSGPGFVR